jgi:hypothetical protein
MKIIVFLFGLGSLMLLAGCDWGEHHHHNEGGAYEGSYYDHGHGGYYDHDGYYHAYPDHR